MAYRESLTDLYESGTIKTILLINAVTLLTDVLRASSRFFKTLTELSMVVWIFTRERSSFSCQRKKWEE